MWIIPPIPAAPPIWGPGLVGKAWKLRPATPQPGWSGVDIHDKPRITLATYRDWSDNPDLGPAQVQDMTERTARAIYQSLYWNPLRADALPRGVDLSVFDMGVNAGIWRSARLLQRALGSGQPTDWPRSSRCGSCSMAPQSQHTRSAASTRSPCQDPLKGTKTRCHRPR
jgi:hypothetical protein